MIFDQCENFRKYNYGPYWEKAFSFINSLTAQTPDGKYEIEKDDIFAIVMSYPTKSENQAVLEAHRKYVDIQSTISGAEAIEYYPQQSLTVTKPYRAETDVEFYEKPLHSIARVNVLPRYFAALWPSDAHMPQLHVPSQSPEVKKVVIKINKELLRSDSGS